MTDTTTEAVERLASRLNNCADTMRRFKAGVMDAHELDQNDNTLRALAAERDTLTARIEELEAAQPTTPSPEAIVRAALERAALCLDVDEYQYVDAETILELADDPAEVAAIIKAGEVLGLSLSDSPMVREVLARMDRARTILAELTGEDRG
jgi:predicted DNA binding protein